MARVVTLFLSSIGLIFVAFLIEYVRDTYLIDNIYCYTSINTLSLPQPSAQCIGVSRRTNLITKVYTSKDTVDTTQKNAQVHDGHVIPGLWDGHGHVHQYGETLQSVDLFQSRGLEDVRAKIAVHLLKNAGQGSREEWVRGIGWDQSAFGGKMPTAADLEVDEALRGKYMMFDRVDVHCVWVSQAVLDLLPKPLPEDIPGGEIVREPGLGVFCDNAMDYVREYFPKPSKEKRATWVRQAMENLNQLGIVGVHDAGVTPSEIALYEELASTDDWTVRIYAMVECAKRNTFCPEDAKIINRPDGRLAVKSVKLFADGALGSWGSAMISPYTDRPTTSGTLLTNATTLNTLAQSWSAAGFQVNIHAIGDLANRLSINALQSALFALCPGESLSSCQSRHRFRIEHAQIIDVNDQVRLFDLGLIPSIQPTHATSDMEYAETRLGKERTEKEAYRMKSLLPLEPVLGSDFPVEPPSVFEGIYAAVSRKSPRTGQGKGGQDDGWNLDEALSFEEALRGFTLNPARAAFLEGKAGVLQVGAFADWVVLDEPFGSGGVEELRSTLVRETWVGGKRVFRRDS